MTRRLLVLTSPHMRGDDVTRAQELLKDNALGRDFLKGGAIDGEYGPWTARATIRAKHWAGYAWNNRTEAYGRYIEAFLTGEAKLPKANQVRAKHRQTMDVKKPRGERVWIEAGKRLGMGEAPPGSNRNAITAEYGLVGPWCFMGASVCSHHAGFEWPIIGAGYRGRGHYCPTGMDDAYYGRNGLSLVKPGFVTIGDLVFFDWGQDKVADHVGIFGWWLDREAGRRLTDAEVLMRARTGKLDWFATREANTDDHFLARERHLSQIARNLRGDLGFVHAGR